MRIRIPGPSGLQTESLLTDATNIAQQPALRGPAPNWSKWINRPKLELWEAIALSLNLDPAEYNPQGIVEDFDTRIEFAIDHLTPGNLLAHVKVAGRKHLTLVSLADAALLARSYRPAWELPPEFPQEEEQQLIQEATTDTQSDAVKAKKTSHKIRNRESLMRMEIAEAKKKANDPESIHNVWDSLTLLAEEGFGIMIGFSSDGVQCRGKTFQETGVPDVLKKTSLKGRMARDKAR